MPYKDPEMKKQKQREWRQKSIESGYGVWLYRRRKLRFDDAERFRETLERIIEVASHGRMTDEKRLLDVVGRARTALAESQQAEAELGRFNGSKS